MMTIVVFIIMLFLPSVLSATVIIQDNFEYVASRSDTTVATVFTAHGWSSCKAENNSQTGADGYLYTQDDATLGSKVLVMESVPVVQTDYYLKYGSDSSSAGTIPANVWFQFWLYATSGSDWTSGGQKFLYPCHSTYPCDAGAYRWILGFRDALSEQPSGPAGTHLFQLTSPYANYTGGEPWNATKMDQNLVTTSMALATWYQVKIHIDTSGAQGTYELWIRERGVSAWTKYAEWLGGVTANFDWSIPVGARNGNIQIAIPTTVDPPNSTMYMDDFMMATTEGDLPTYSDAFASSTVSGATRFTGSVRIQ